MSNACTHLMSGIRYEADERNLDRHLASDLRGVPTDFDELMDLALETDFADAVSVMTGMSVLPIRSRSRLNIPAEREHGARASSSCPAWSDPKKAYSTNRGPRLHPPNSTPDKSATSAKSAASAKSTASIENVGGDFFQI